MNKFPILINILVFILISGCIKNEGKIDNKLEKEKAITNANKNTCLGYGFSEGTDQFSNCMMQLDISRKEKNALREILRCNRIKERQANKKGPSLSGWGAILEGALDQAELSSCK